MAVTMLASAALTMAGPGFTLRTWESVKAAKERSSSAGSRRPNEPPAILHEMLR
jgi:hypothetical protein